MRWLFGRRRIRDGLASRIVLDVGPNLRAQVRALDRFLAQHDGPEHAVRARWRRGRREVYCACDAPGAEQPEIPLALVEDDLIDG